MYYVATNEILVILTDEYVNNIFARVVSFFQDFGTGGKFFVGWGNLMLL